MSRRPEPALAGAAFVRAFPFHLQIDRDLRIVAAGPSLRKACPALRVGRSLGELFAVGRPLRVDSFEGWQACVGELCTLSTHAPPALTLRGSVEAAGDDTLLLLVTPVMNDMGDMRRLRLAVNDFAKHDATTDSLLLAQTARMSAADARRLSDRLAARSEQLGAIIELSRNGVAYFDENGLPQHMNQAWLELLGMERVSAFELSLDRVDGWLAGVLSPAEACRRPLRALMGDAALAAGITLQLERPRRAVLRLAHARTSTGGAVFYLHDITRESEVDRMKTEFLTTAAHELRTPMVSVFGFTELLLRRPVPEERRRDMLETIHRQSSVLIHMVNELLDLARIEARQGKDFMPQPCRIGDLVADALAGFAGEPEAQRIRLDLPLAAAEVVLDPQKTLRAFSNVLSNAFKYSPQGGEVRIATRPGCIGERPAVGVSIRDSGIGMTAEQLARVFERFYRADPSGNIPGTGLGMSLVKEIVELQHGRVDVSSAPGQGTEVTLWWPVAPAQPVVAVQRRAALLEMP